MSKVTPPIQTATVRRFASALASAVLDREIEETRPVLFYYDADVILRIINGFQQFKYDAQPNTDPRNLMVRSLLSLGYAGTIYVLRPHVLEVYEALRSRPAFQRPRRGDFKDELVNFLNKGGILDLFMNLRDAISQARNESERLDSFFRVLADVDPASFAMIELADGSWQQRLATLTHNDLLRFDDGEVEMRDILRDPIVSEIRNLVGAERKRRGQAGAEFTLSVLRDATALALLHREITRYGSANDLPAVRFYSETDVLHEVWRDPSSRLRSLLTYHSGLTDHIGAGFAVRDADYFILRMLLDGVHFEASTVSEEISPISLADLRNLSGELSVLVNQGEEDLEKFLATQIGELPLKDYIDDFESLGFINRFLRTYTPPERLKEAVRGLPEVWEFAVRPEVRDRFAEDTRKILDKLAKTVQGLRTTFADLRKILDASTAFRQSNKNYGTPDPVKDLGLVRWE